MKHKLLFIAGIFALVLRGAPPAYSYSWTQLGRPGGWISSIAFHPTKAGEVWASGDDSAGLYRSTDGGNTWTLFTNTPANQSTFGLAIDPSNPTNVYAPSHYGRGMLCTHDGGNTWSQVSGLPSPNLTGNVKLTWQTAVNPVNSNVIFVATGSGLYFSQDKGNTWNPIPASNFTPETDFRAVAFSTDGAFILAASSNGLVYQSSNGGSVWTSIVPVTHIPIVGLAATPSAVYGLFATGTVIRIPAPSYNSFTSNAGTGISGSNLKLAVAVISGAPGGNDYVYIASTNNGFFQSADSGTSFSSEGTLPGGNSVNTMAVDPLAPQTLIASTLGNGLFITTTGGTSWSALPNTGLSAGTSTGLGQDPSNPQHLLNGDFTGDFGVAYETFNGGSNWSAVPSFGVGVLAFDIDPLNSQTILAGTYSHGIYRTTQGSGTGWAQVLSSSAEIQRFVRDKVDSQNVYAAAPLPTHLYYSSNGGQSFSDTGIVGFNVAAHPVNKGEAIAVGSDALATTHFFASNNSLGVAAIAPPSEGGFTAVAYDPGTPSTVLVGGASGDLFLTTNYSPSGSNVAWSKISSPVIGTFITDIVIKVRADGGRDWYLATFGGSTNFNSQTTSGIFMSTNEGAQWTELSNGMFPCSIAWRFFESANNSSQFYAAMWSGGVLDLTQVDPVQSSSSTLSTNLSQIQIYPNPMRPSLGHKGINFTQLPAGARLRIYTLAGEKVNDLSADATGHATWDGTNESGHNAASGIYLVYIQGAGDSKTLKVAIQR